jgi:ABC-2 type transport system ATP-binding protein
MRKLGRKQLTLQLQNPINAIPASLAQYSLVLSEDRQQLVYSFDTQAEQSGIGELLRRLNAEGVDFRDLHTQESSLEEIFVSLVRKQA